MKPVGVKHRIEEIELRPVEAQMAPVLRAFLHQVWDKRGEPDFDIYKIYVGGRPHEVVEDDGTPWDKGQVEAFLEQLKFITTPEPMIQHYGDSLGMAISSLEDPSIANLQELAREEDQDWIVRDLGKSFFHFRTGSSPQKRLYLSVLPPFRGTVMRHIVTNVVNQNPDVTNAKVSGPLCKGLDNIVIYARNNTAIGTALSVLAEYQKTPARSYFSHQTIQLARQVRTYGDDTLTGVAAADEPFEHAQQLGLDRRPSFGDFWELLLGWVMDDEPLPATKLAFFKKVLTTMQQVGMDPLRPEL